MTASDWLARLDPAPPEELANAIRGALDQSESDPTAEDLLHAAERLLEKILRSDCETRSSAMDLLAVDALMTQALLISSRDLNAPDDFAEQAMMRVTSLWK